jgi:membrane-associated phospholipid phosphatase
LYGWKRENIAAWCETRRSHFNLSEADFIKIIKVTSDIHSREMRAEMVLSNEYQLTRRDLLVMGVVILVVLVAGVALYAAGYNESFYSTSEVVQNVFEAITHLGNEVLYLVVLSLIYLSYDKRFGRRLCLLFFFMVYLTDLLKEFFRDPRPPSNLERDTPYTGYGLPSGHTTTSVTFYGYVMLSHLGMSRARLPLVLLCGFTIVSVPISRMVIGVHDLQDVVSGAVMALSILTAYMVLLPRLSKVVRSWPLRDQLVIGISVALLFWLMGAMVLALRHPGDVIIALEELSMGAGLLLGCAIAFPLEEAYVDYRPELMSTGKRVTAALIGLPVTVVVYVGLSVVSDLVLPEHAADMMTYSVLMVVLALFVPMLLRRYVVGEGPSV